MNSPADAAEKNGVRENSLKTEMASGKLMLNFSFFLKKKRGVTNLAVYISIEARRLTLFSSLVLNRQIRSD